MLRPDLTLLVSIVILGLAAYRAARLVTRDSITDGLRGRLYAWAWNDDGGRAPEPIARAPWRTYIYEGLSCGYCVGVWAAGAMYVLAWSAGIVRYAGLGGALVLVLAIAGVQAVVVTKLDA